MRKLFVAGVCNRNEPHSIVRTKMAVSLILACILTILSLHMHSYFLGLKLKVYSYYQPYNIQPPNITSAPCHQSAQLVWSL